MSLLKSLFTEHVATKFMALLLAVVLFVFVQQEIEGKITIDRIRLEFELAASERGRHTLVTTNIELVEVEVKGTKKDIDVLVERFEQSPTRTIEVDSRFLARYSGTIEKRITVNEEFLKEHKVVPDDINVLSLRADRKLSIHRNEIISMKLELAPGMEERTLLETDPAKRKHQFQGTAEGGNRVDISFDPPQVQVRAPRFCFTGSAAVTNRVAKVQIRTVDDYLVDVHIQSASEVVNMPIENFDWDGSGIVEANFKEYAEFRIGDRWVSWENFAGRLSARFEVRQQSKFLKRNLELRYLTREGRDLKYLAAYELEGPLGAVEFDPQGQRVDFWLQMPQGFDESFLDALVVVLDIASAKRSGDKVDIPLKLDLDAKDRLKEDLLSRVQIRLEAGHDYAYARYKKKQ